MSIALVHVERGRALVGVDSTGSLGRPLHKIVAMPSYVLAFRGLNALFSAVLAIAHQRSLTLDELNEPDTKLLETAHRTAATVAQEDAPLECQIFVVGWSERAKAMTATAHTVQQGGDVSIVPIVDTVIAGADASWGSPPFQTMGSHKAMEQVARWQIANMRETWPDGACGGRLLIAELTPGVVTIRTQCELG